MELLVRRQVCKGQEEEHSEKMDQFSGPKSEDEVGACEEQK